MLRNNFITLVLLGLLCFSFNLTAYAGGTAVTVKVNGDTVKFDQPPYTESGRVMVPVRAPLEAMGCTVIWDDALQQAKVSKGTVISVFTVGSKAYSVNGQIKAMDVAPRLVNGRTAFPVRYVVEAMGGNVGWDEAAQTVSITYPPKNEPQQIKEILTVEQVFDKYLTATNAQKYFKVNSIITSTTAYHVKSSNDTYSESNQENEKEATKAFYQCDPFCMYSITTENSNTVTESMENKDGTFVKSENGTWIKDPSLVTPKGFDFQNVDSMSEYKDNWNLKFLPDEVKNGKQCWVISASLVPNSNLATNLDLVFAKTLEEEIKSDPEADPETIAIMLTQLKLVSINVDTTLWIDKETNLCSSITQQLSMSLKLSYPDDDNPTMKMDMNLDIGANSEIYDYGIPSKMPDISKAIERMSSDSKV